MALFEIIHWTHQRKCFQFFFVRLVDFHSTIHAFSMESIEYFFSYFTSIEKRNEKHAVKIHKKKKKWAKRRFTFYFVVSCNKTQWLMVYGVVRNSLLIYVNVDGSSVQCACSRMGCNRDVRVCVYVSNLNGNVKQKYSTFTGRLYVKCVLLR